MRFLRPSTGLFTALAILAFSAPELHAQRVLGFRGGVSVSSVEADLSDTFDDSNRTGFVGGVFLDFGGSSPLGLQIGAQYSQKGAEIDFDDVVEDLDLAYLEIPAVVKFGIPLGAIKPSILGGAALGFNVKCEYGSAVSCDDEVTSTEWAGILGADVAFYLGGLSLWVDGRFHFGLNDISDALEVDELKNRAWQLQGGIGFPLGG